MKTLTNASARRSAVARRTTLTTSNDGRARDDQVEGQAEEGGANARRLARRAAARTARAPRHQARRSQEKRRTHTNARASLRGSRPPPRCPAASRSRPEAERDRRRPRRRRSVGPARRRATSSLISRASSRARDAIEPRAPSIVPRKASKLRARARASGRRRRARWYLETIAHATNRGASAWSNRALSTARGRLPPLRRRRLRHGGALKPFATRSPARGCASSSRAQARTRRPRGLARSSLGDAHLAVGPLRREPVAAARHPASCARAEALLVLESPGEVRGAPRCWTTPSIASARRETLSTRTLRAGPQDVLAERSRTARAPHAARDRLDAHSPPCPTAAARARRASRTPTCRSAGRGQGDLAHRPSARDLARATADERPSRTRRRATPPTCRRRCASDRVRRRLADDRRASGRAAAARVAPRPRPSRRRAALGQRATTRSRARDELALLAGRRARARSTARSRTAASLATDAPAACARARVEILELRQRDQVLDDAVRPRSRAGAGSWPAPGRASWVMSRCATTAAPIVAARRSSPRRPQVGTPPHALVQERAHAMRRRAHAPLQAAPRTLAAWGARRDQMFEDMMKKQRESEAPGAAPSLAPRRRAETSPTDRTRLASCAPVQLCSLSLARRHARGGQEAGPCPRDDDDAPTDVRRPRRPFRSALRRRRRRPGCWRAAAAVGCQTRPATSCGRRVGLDGADRPRLQRTEPSGRPSTGLEHATKRAARGRRRVARFARARVAASPRGSRRRAGGPNPHALTFTASAARVVRHQGPCLCFGLVGPATDRELRIATRERLPAGPWSRRCRVTDIWRAADRRSFFAEPPPRDGRESASASRRRLTARQPRRRAADDGLVAKVDGRQAARTATLRAGAGHASLTIMTSYSGSLLAAGSRGGVRGAAVGFVLDALAWGQRSWRRSHQRTQWRSSCRPTISCRGGAQRSSVVLPSSVSLPLAPLAALHRSASVRSAPVWIAVWRRRRRGVRGARARRKRARAIARGGGGDGGALVTEAGAAARGRRRRKVDGRNVLEGAGCSTPCGTTTLEVVQRGAGGVPLPHESRVEELFDERPRGRARSASAMNCGTRARGRARAATRAAARGGPSQPQIAARELR